MALEETIGLLLVIAIFAVLIAGMWKMFEKADQPGWAALIPIYNVWILLKIGGRPGWWLLLFFVPVINWVVPLIMYWDVAKNFGKSDGFAVALVLFPVLCVYLGFSDDTYQPRSAEEAFLSDYYEL